MIFFIYLKTTNHQDMTGLSLRSILLVCLITVVPTASAQQNINEAKHLTEHVPIMNSAWETFDLLMYRVTTEKGKKVYAPHFPPRLEAMDGKMVALQGYVVPIKPGFRHNRFLLSVLPIDQCMFCGQDGIPAMVEVTLSGGKKVRASDRPILIRGKTVLNGMDRKRVEIWIEKASIVTN
ncbi:hypothetical protein VJ786_02370 [Sphingobacterium sp. PU5-4]|uniref:DUF3299 domain-containing protein n=1 Tax=Sphingobacterium tenebrionis TaxID=3111775 RepID=A0ABU8I215_9SPHI